MNVNKVNYSDASSIQNYASSNNVTAQSGGRTINAATLQQDYAAVKQAPNSVSAATQYASDLSALANAEGATSSDTQSVNGASRAALQGAGVSDLDIGYAQEPAGKVNFADAHSIQAGAAQNGIEGPAGNTNNGADIIAQDYAAVQKSPSSAAAATQYAKDLFAIAHYQGAGSTNTAALNAAATAALHNAGVSDDNIKSALSEAASQLTAPLTGAASFQSPYTAMPTGPNPYNGQATVNSTSSSSTSFPSPYTAEPAGFDAYNGQATINVSTNSWQ